MPAYQSYFDNFFATLPISRVNFKALGTSALTAGRQAGLGPEFTAHFTALEAALNGFDENLGEADESTAGDTEAFRTARKNWLTFVDDATKDHVTPKLRKLPIYADFRKYFKSKLALLSQPELLQESKQLLALYTEHAAALNHAPLVAEAQAVYQQLTATDESRSTAGSAISGARVALTADWLALARALRRFKAQLELTFNDSAEVYRFFDFGKTYRAVRVAKDARDKQLASSL